MSHLAWQINTSGCPYRHELVDDAGEIHGVVLFGRWDADQERRMFRGWWHGEPLGESDSPVGACQLVDRRARKAWAE